MPPSYWRNHWGRWGFVVVGLVSLVWFLVRVLPKPRRAAYPCQQVAAPLAGSFLAWLGLLVFSSAVWNQSKTFWQRFRRGSVAAYVALAVLLVLVVVIRLPMPSAHADVSPLDSSSAIGTGKGIHPGRVVWVHNPQATDNSVYSAPQYWWQTNHTDGAVVEQMFSQAIRSLTGQGTHDATAWDALFHHFNETHGRGYIGYTAGEKIAIKLNLVSCMSIPTNTHIKATNELTRIDPAPQMIRALLRHLVDTVGVAQTNIFIGDPTALVPHYYWDMLHPEFPDVHWVENSGGNGRERVAFSLVPVYWSTNAADGKILDFLPTAFADADYIINFAVLKWHSCGVTLCGKNNYGSLIRKPDRTLWGTLTDYYDMHLSLPNQGWSPGTGRYRAIVDLMGHPDLGGKTILYLIDGLYSGVGWKSTQKKWNSYPFGSGVVSKWPSSLFLSQDPVAIDSVAYDFLFAESSVMVTNGVNSLSTSETKFTLGPANALKGGAEDYLHEAALAHSPLSGTFYDSDRDGIRMESLGVHEHWNNSTNKQYSRNLGLSEGIELVAIGADAMVPPVITEGASVNVTMSEDAAPTPFNLTLHATNASQGSLIWWIGNAAAHGTASVGTAGTSAVINYTPVPNFSGSDSFVVHVANDGGSADTCTVNVNVQSVNDAPVAVAHGDPLSGSITNEFYFWGTESYDLDGTIATYEWKIGGAVVSTNADFLRKFTTNGTYALTLTVRDNAGGLGSGTVAVNVSGAAASVVSVAASDSTAGEPGLTEGTGKFTISRTGNLTAAITVRYAMSGTASNGVDYTKLSGTVSLAAGKTSASLTLTPLVDAADEPDETAILTLLPGTGYTPDTAKSAATVTIKDQTYGMPLVSAVTTDASAAEPGLTVNNGSIKISRIGSCHAALTVLCGMSGTASNGVDYTKVVVPVTLAIGQSSKTLTITPQADGVVESNETVTLTIQTNTAYQIEAGKGAASVTITDKTDLTTPTVSVVATDASAIELNINKGTLQFTRNSRFHEALVVNYVISGTASNGVDYATLSSTLTIPAGVATKTLTVTPKADGLTEGTETVVMTISASSGYTIDAAKGTATVTIKD